MMNNNEKQKCPARGSMKMDENRPYNNVGR
jgi:hypothetical protein